MANPISTTVVKIFEYPVKRFGLFKATTNNDILARVEFIRNQSDKTANQSETNEFQSNTLDFVKGLYVSLGQFFKENNIDPTK